MRQGSAWSGRGRAGRGRAPFVAKGRGYGRRRRWKRIRRYGGTRSTASRIGKFVIYSLIATAILWGIVYVATWFVYEILPTVEKNAPETTENEDDERDGSGDDVFDLLADNFTPVLYTTEEVSRENLAYINEIREEHNRKPISFDVRAYDLALARVRDNLQYDYRDHMNPHTGTCPYTMKSEYGFASNENVAENLAWIEGAGYMGPNRAVGIWMDSVGHRHNLLYSTHTGGATACDRGVCIFLGVNLDRFGMGCYTAAEGKAYWEGRGG